MKVAKHSAMRTYRETGGKAPCHCNFCHCMRSQVGGGTQAEGVREYGAEDEIWV